MSFDPVTAIAGNLLGGAIGAWGAKKAGKAQERALQEQLAYLEKSKGEARADLAPYRQSGEQALNALAALYGLNGQLPDYGMLTDNPAYKFRLAEGFKALENSAAARGRLLSGAQAKASQRYGQDLASTEYDRLATRLTNLAGFGQDAASDTARLSAGLAGQAGATIGGVGDARASSYLGTADALRQAISGAIRPEDIQKIGG